MRISDEEITDFLLNFIAERDYVLDVGCGDCSRLKEIKKLREINAFGIDIFISHKNNKNYEVVCREIKAEDINKLSEKFNLIFTAYSFHHFNDPKKFLINAKNRLLQGGRLIIIEWKYDTVTSNPDEEYYRAKEMEEFLTDAGFKIENEIFQDDTQIFIAF